MVLPASALRRRRHLLVALGCGLAAVFAGCNVNPNLDLEAQAPAPGTEPKVLVDEGKRAASRHEYRQLLKENAPDPETREMLDQLLKVTQNISGNGLDAGNDARPLVDGPQTFEEMFSDIEQASSTVHLETFILEDDRIGRALAERLIAARQRGVEVRVQIDAVGSINLPEAFIEELRGHGIEVQKFHPVDPTEDLRIWRTNNRNHRKILVIDGSIAYTGGINFSGVYSKGSLSVPRHAGKADSAWRDTHVRIVGPVVKRFQQRFLEMWNKDLAEEDRIGGDEFFPELNTEGEMMVGVIASVGGDEEESDIYDVLGAAITHARKRIWVTQAYFAPDDGFTKIIKSAAERGVDVRLLLPGVSDAPLVVQASRAIYQELLDSGVRIYERTGSTLHAKTVVIDGVWSTVGSANFDYRSFVHNYELNAVIVSDSFGHTMENLFQLDLKQCEEITPEKWEDRPIMQRLKETVGDTLRRWL